MQDSRAFGLGVAVADLCAYRYIRDIYRERERERERETLGGTAAFPAFFLVLYMCAFV